MLATKYRPVALSAVFLIVLVSCGKKAGPYPPVIVQPEAITDLRARQVGDGIELRATLPDRNTDGSFLDTIEKVVIYRIEQKAQASSGLDGKSGTSEEELAELLGRSGGGGAPGGIQAIARTRKTESSASPRKSKQEQTAELFGETTDGTTVESLSGPATFNELPGMDADNADAFFSQAKVVRALRSEDIAEADEEGRVYWIDPVLTIIPEEAESDADEVTESDSDEDTLGVEEEEPFSPYRQRYIYAFRTYTSNSGAGRISNIVVFIPREPPPTPENVRIESSEKGVRLRWTMPRPEESESESPTWTYNVYRAEDEEEYGWRPVNGMKIPTESYIDLKAEYGKSYRYLVRAYVGSSGSSVESGSSEEVTIDFVDDYPPPTPAGLDLVVTEGAVQLLWSRLDVEDLVGYFVYRRREGGEPEKLNEDPSTRYTFQDEAFLERGQYYYSVSALDESGNESPRSREVRHTQE